MPQAAPHARLVACVALVLPILLSVPFAGVKPAHAGEALPAIQAAPEVRTGQAPAVTPDDRFVLKFKAPADGPASEAGRRGNAYGQVARRLGISVHELRVDQQGRAVVKAERQLSDAEADQVAAALAASPDVEYAEVDTFLRPAAAAPNDPLYPRQWDLFEENGGIRMPGAWERSTGAGQVIAVIDSGIAPHSDLLDRTVAGYDFITDPAMARDGGGRDANPRDEGDWCGTGTSSWHGTHVAGTIGAAANNSKGIAGVAYGAKIQPIRALGSCGGYMSDVADAVTWAVGGDVTGVPANPNPARVVNLSLGATAACGTTFQNVLSFAAGKGAAVVVAAGNDNQPAANSSPANCNNVISVGATGREGARAPYSNYGSAVDVSAPGGYMGTGSANGIASTWNLGTTTPGAEGYAYQQGTSMAAPHVAGVAALMFAEVPDTTPAKIEDVLKSTARALPGGCDIGGCGAGLIDASAALAGLPGSAPPPAPEPKELTPAAATVSGSAAVGTTLRAVEGSWAPAPVTFAYQWTRNGTPIAMATNPTYTATQQDLSQNLAVIVTGSKPGYEPASSTSPPVKVRPFVDVETNHPFATEITWLAANNISTGWAEQDGTATYRPNLAVSRDAMAAFMYRLKKSPDYSAPSVPPFADVPVDADFYKEISWLAAEEVSTGWTEPDGTRTYRPYLAVTRNAMAAFMYRLSGSPDYTPPQVSPFVDVAVGDAFYKEISWLAASKISTGWDMGDGTRRFEPYSAVARDAMAAFMFRYATAAAAS